MQGENDGCSTSDESDTTAGSGQVVEEGGRGRAGAGEAGGRCYVLGQVLPVEEDLCHEFKGHRSLSIHDIHNVCLQGVGPSHERTRNAVSVTIGALLNASLGGTVYLGVSDCGRVRGLSMTRYQQDHVQASLEWTLDHFTPPVPPDRYAVNFVPVVPSSFSSLPSTAHELVDEHRRLRPHHVAFPHFCWCDQDAAAQISMGRMLRVYVVEVHVRPWDPHLLPGPLSLPPVPPLHLTEAHGCFVRQSCRQPRLCLDEVKRLLQHRVEEHFSLKLAALRHRQQALLHLAHSHGVQPASSQALPHVCQPSPPAKCPTLPSEAQCKTASSTSPPHTYASLTSSPHT